MNTIIRSETLGKQITRLRYGKLYNTKMAIRGTVVKSELEVAQVRYDTI
jgi:hypothetical protein